MWDANREMDMAQSKKATKKNMASANKMASLDKNKATRIVALRILIIVIVDLAVGILLKRQAGLEPVAALNFHNNVLPILKYVFAGLVILSAAYVIFTLLKHIDTSAHIMTPLMIFAVAMYLAVTAVFLDKFTSAPYLFWTMTVLVSVLFAVYYIYTVLMYKK